MPWNDPSFDAQIFMAFAGSYFDPIPQSWQGNIENLDISRARAERATVDSWSSEEISANSHLGAAESEYYMFVT